MDELYRIARKVLIDALEALEPHREAIIVVGAQALYLQVGESELAVAPFTTDGDLAIDPALLAELPPLERALSDAGFIPGGRDAVGVWLARRSLTSMPDLMVQIDLLVPEAVSPGRGRRAARLPGHEPKAARSVRGLEGAIVDHDVMRIDALDLADPRKVEARVAGPAALLVAKLHKIAERKGTARASDKDALDVFRLLRAVSTETFAARLRRVLADPRSAAAGRRALDLLDELFHRGGEGSAMAARALAGLVDDAEVRLSCEILARDLLAAAE